MGERLAIKVSDCESLLRIFSCGSGIRLASYTSRNYIVVLLQAKKTGKLVPHSSRGLYSLYDSPIPESLIASSDFQIPPGSSQKCYPPKQNQKHAGIPLTVLHGPRTWDSHKAIILMPCQALGHWSFDARPGIRHPEVARVA